MEVDGVPSSAERADGERVARGSLLCRAMISLLMRATSVGDSNAQHQCQPGWKFPASKHGEKRDLLQKPRLCKSIYVT